MKFRSIAIFLAIVLLLGGAFTASGAAGSREDPLLTKNYTEGEFTKTVLNDTASGINFAHRDASRVRDRSRRAVLAHGRQGGGLHGLAGAQ